jgi:predicted TPR repeat methyltransferase
MDLFDWGLMKEIFDNYTEHASHWKFDEFKVRQFEFNYRALFPHAGAETLDIGVGQGEMLACMRDWGFKYMGVDITESTVAACRKRDLTCELVSDTGKFLRENENRFSVITMLDVLEHIPRGAMIPLLKDVRTALKPGGLAIIQVPSAQAVESHLHRYNDITHEVCFSERSLSQVLLGAGFEQPDFVGYEVFPQQTLKMALKRFLRSVAWGLVRFQRRLTGNLDPEILAPVLVAIVEKKGG